MKIYVGGVNAVGKSTVVKETAERLGFKYIHATTGLLQHLGIDKDYEKLRSLTQETRNRKLGEYIECLLKDQTCESFLLDSHYLCLVRGKVDPITDSWLEHFDKLALISAPLEDVWRRIAADANIRDRALFPIDLSESQKKTMLASYQDQTAKEFTKLAEKYAKPSIEVMNKEGEKDAAITELRGFISEDIII